MLYMTTADGSVRIIVLESGNLEAIKGGRPARTPDGSVLIAWTPDSVWLADRIMDTDGDGAAIGRLIDEAAKRPEKPGPRPTHLLHEHGFGPQPTVPLRDHLVGLTTGQCVWCGESTHRIQSHPHLTCRPKETAHARPGE
jgi:hypothetical protein